MPCTDGGRGYDDDRLQKATRAARDMLATIRLENVTMFRLLPSTIVWELYT
jgi:hypothetical protein